MITIILPVLYIYYFYIINKKHVSNQLYFFNNVARMCVFISYNLNLFNCLNFIN